MSGSITVTLSGVPTEDMSLEFTLPAGFHEHGQDWQISDDGSAWASINTSFLITPDDAVVGKWLRVVVDAYNDFDDPYLAVSDAVVVLGVNDDPAGGLTVSGTARQGEALTLADTVTDADGVPIRTYVWQVADGDGGWTTIDDAHGASFTPTQAEVGRAVRAGVGYTDGQGTTEAVWSDATLAVENVNDAPQGLPTSLGGPGAPAEGEAVAVDTSGVTDADGLGTFTYAWSRETDGGDWVEIDGADGASYTPGDADVGARLKVEVAYSDGCGESEAFAVTTAEPVANVNSLPTGSIALSGEFVRGQAVVASADFLADADGMGPVSFQWERDGEHGWTPISDATGASYTLQAADIGHSLRVVAGWRDGHGTDETASAATGTVAPRTVALPPPEDGEDERNAAADDWSSSDLGARLADGDVLIRPPGAESIMLADGVLSFGSGTEQAFLARLYLGLLGREGDAGGLAFLGGAAGAGASRADLADVLLSSAEYRAGHGAPTDAAFVADLYVGFLGRAGGDDERGYWEGSLQRGASRADIAQGIADSGEARGHLQAATDGVFVPDAGGVLARSLYHCALGREAEAPGLAHWSRLLVGGTDLRTVGTGLGGAEEFGARHGASTDSEFVQALYRDGFGRDAEAAGLNHWVGLLQSGQLGRGEVALHVALTQEARDCLDWAL